MCFSSQHVFLISKAPLGEILGRNYYPFFTNEEIEVQITLMIAKNSIVKKKKEMELNHSFSESQVQTLFSLPLFALRELRRAVYIAGQSLEEALIDKKFIPKMHLVSIFRKSKVCET